MAAVALATAPLAFAQDPCAAGLGRGWPPATEAHGAAVETLLGGDAAPALRIAFLPRRGEERVLALLPGADGADWTLRYAVAEERVLFERSTAGGFTRELRTAQAPEAVEVPVPADVGRRIVDAWTRTLGALVPSDRAAAYHDADIVLLTLAADGAEPQRLGGRVPGCGAGEVLWEQVELLIEATDDGDERRLRRWEQIDENIAAVERRLANIDD